MAMANFAAIETVAAISYSVMPGLVPGIHVFIHLSESGRPGERAFTPVFDGLCPAMTE
jgi:hypothetical protein